MLFKFFKTGKSSFSAKNLLLLMFSLVVTVQNQTILANSTDLDSLSDVTNIDNIELENKVIRELVNFLLLSGCISLIRILLEQLMTSRERTSNHFINNTEQFNVMDEVNQVVNQIPRGSTLVTRGVRLIREDLEIDSIYRELGEIHPDLPPIYTVPLEMIEPAPEYLNESLLGNKNLVLKDKELRTTKTKLALSEDKLPSPQLNSIFQNHPVLSQQNPEQYSEKPNQCEEEQQISHS